MRLRARSRGAVPAAAPPTPDPALLAAAVDAARINAFVDALTARAVPHQQPNPGPVTSALFERMTREQVTQIEAVLDDGGAQEMWHATPVEQRALLALTFAAYYNVEAALASTGLTRAVPPEDVHSMARGALTYGGDPMLADMVAAAFAAAGLPLPDHGTLLDFGCSSGRALRVLAAYKPELTSLGCDPNGGAIAWASEHLPMARFFTNDTVPPLDLPDASVDRAYAISIWSHFDAGSALAWLAEMHRVVKPGGALLLTTHGLDTLGGQLREDLMTQDSAAEATAAMLQEGHKYFDIFGEDGDWGVKDPGWGNSYTGVDWLAANVTPAWAIRLFRPAMLAQNQDVFVLGRTP